MNWGYKILIVIIAFILIMLGMVYVAMQQTNDMEDTNYYEKELKYQSKIDASNNLNAYNSDSILLQLKDAVQIRIPEGLDTDFKNGSLEFLRSDDKRKDVNVSFLPDSAGVFKISKSRFTHGFYKVRIAWDNGAQHYYKETSISIQP